jgi:hypothetical protein
MTDIYTVTIVTANLRDIDGCDSEQAVAAIYAAAEKAASLFAADNLISISVQEPEFPYDRQSRTVIVGFDIPHDYEAQLDAMKMAQEIEYAIDDAIDQAIQAGDWDDTPEEEEEEEDAADALIAALMARSEPSSKRVKLYNTKTGKEVRRGDIVTNFRGEHATVIDWHPPHKPASSGRIEVEYMAGGGGGSYYPSVFGCEFREG